MAKNLTTVFLYRQYAEITTDTQTDLMLTRLIDQVSQAIAAYCDRTFELTTYKQWLDGTGRSFLALPQWPVTRLLGASTDTTDVGRLQFTGGTWATTTLKDGVLYLDSIDTAGAETSEEITLASFPIMSGLATEVGTKTGWTLTVDGDNGTQPSTLLRPFDGQWALSTDDIDLEIAEETDAVRLIESSNQQIEYPSGRAFPSGSQNVFVWYKAGYTLPVDNTNHTKLTTDGNVPDDLTLIANEILSAVFNAAGEAFTGVASEKIGNYSYTLGEGAQSAIQSSVMDHSAALTPHRSSRII